MSAIKSFLKVLLYGIVFLFFFQLLADFIEAVYAFGLMGTSIPPEIASVALLFSPIVLLLFRRRLPGWLLLVLGEGILISRVVEGLLDTRGRMIVSGLGVGCFLIFFPALFVHGSWSKPRVSTLGAGLALSLAASVALRAWGSGYDLSTFTGYQGITWALALIACALFVLELLDKSTFGEEAPAEASQAGAGRTLLLALGLTGVWALLYFGFIAPNVLARHTGESYAWIIAFVAAGLTVAAAVVTHPELLDRIKPRFAVAGIALFAASWTGSLLVYQIRFPAEPAGYPLYEPPVQPLARIPFWLMLVLFPFVPIAWALLARELGLARRSPRQLGWTFSLSSLFLLLLILGQTFTTVYDYIPVVGPFFRDKFWLVFLVPGLVTMASLLVLRRPSRAPDGVTRCAWGAWTVPAVVAILGIAALTGVLTGIPDPAVPAAPRGRLRVFTYNIQQGYGASAVRNHAGQLEVLRLQDADIIGLQETDNARIAGGNSDVVRYLADRLNMYSYYGPKTVPGTFGIALLSRYPIENARTFYMYSLGEQAATITAQVRVGDQVFDVFVTHLGNGGPLIQQQAILQEVAKADHVVLMGDFNFRPDSEQYALTTAALVDAWATRWPDGVDGSGRRFDRRIDHVFVSPGTDIADAQYYTGPESDHPALMVEIEW